MLSLCLAHKSWSVYLVVSLNSGATTLSQETFYFQEKLTQKGKETKSTRKRVRRN